MTTLVVASAKGSPGATTTALAVAWWWSRPVVLLEADPAGGDLAADLGLREEPGLVNLAADLRRSQDGEPTGQAIEAQAHQIRPGLSVIPAPASAARARAACDLLPSFGAIPRPVGVDLVVDVGRVTTSEPRLADGDNRFPVCWVVRPRLGAVAHLLEVIGHPPDQRQSAIVIVGTGPYGDAEVSEATGLEVLAHLPDDPTGVAALLAHHERRWLRSPLGRASRSLAAALEAWLDPPAGGALTGTDLVGDDSVEPDAHPVDSLTATP